MNNIDKKAIMKRLQEQQDYVLTKSRVTKDQVLGIFLYGSQNYGFANPDSDIDSEVIVLPTFEDVCFTPQMISEEWQMQNGEHVEIKDLRLMREMWMKQNINFTEILFTEYFILNPRYEELFNKYFVKNREAIAHYDMAKAFKSIGGQLLHTLKQIPPGGDNKKLYNAGRLYYFLEHYLNGYPYMECIQPEGMDYVKLWQLKYHQSALSKSELSMQKYADELKTSIAKLAKEYPNPYSDLRYEAKTALDEGVKEILKQAFGLRNNDFILKKDFFDTLTVTEMQAYYTLIEHTHEEGTVIISSLVDTTNFSRPVYTNLINKMKQAGVAEIKSLGAKGMHIKLVQPELRAEAMKH